MEISLHSDLARYIEEVIFSSHISDYLLVILGGVLIFIALFMVIE